MKNITNALNKLTKLLAVAIISVSLNAFGVMMGPNITISANHVSATAGTAITPVTISNTGDAAFYYSISPAISNGLSFNTKTGTISGMPIVASNPVTYVVTAVNFFAEDTATVVIAVGVGDINLAFGKHATQSSTYPYSVLTVAGYAVDGNTDGEFLHRSTTHTKYEQGAWWQVDLGSKKNINTIIIHNRTDCCANRLSNYQVSISDKADFSTHTYQQDFHVAPNPKKIIQLDASGKQGRYVRIQLLDKNYLSLAEVQVMGVDPLRFPEVDTSSAQNDFGGLHNAPSYPNISAFSTLKANGSIKAWGDSDSGGSDAPAGSGYTKIYSNASAFAALKADGSIKAWSDSRFGGPDAPAGSGYTKIYSTSTAFAALKADGSIKAWSDLRFGGTGAPTDKGYTKIYSNLYAFAALKADGSITAWGAPGFGGSDAPAGTGYTKIYSTEQAFATLKVDGSIKAWGDSRLGGSGAPSGNGYTKIYSNARAFAALKDDGSIKAWGLSGYGVSDVPTDSGYTKIYSTKYAFAALKADGSITAWGLLGSGGTNAPTDKGYTKIYSNLYAFVALKADGSITAWGAPGWGSTSAPADKGYIKIYSNEGAFTAVKADGSIRTWGNPEYGGAYATGYNLALGKPATESSTYPYSILVAASYAVDGNTDGEFLNGSTTHTNIEQGAWWQVDLGSKKNINEIIIYNRIDCCANRLSNYQVSISDKADFSTHTYQQDFHVAPNPKTNIKLDAPGKQGRYVRIQLLDKNYLSLAEVQVIGADL